MPRIFRINAQHKHARPVIKALTRLFARGGKYFSHVFPSKKLRMRLMWFPLKKTGMELRKQRYRKFHVTPFSEQTVSFSAFFHSVHSSGIYIYTFDNGEKWIRWKGTNLLRKASDHHSSPGLLRRPGSPAVWLSQGWKFEGGSWIKHLIRWTRTTSKCHTGNGSLA